MDAKNKNDEVIQLDGEKISLTDFVQASSNSSLFSGQTTIVIENLLSRKKSKEVEGLWDFLKNYNGEAKLILWEKKSVGKILQRNLPIKTTAKEFKTPALIFKFVEQINPKFKSQALASMQQVLQQEPAEFIFAMIIRQIRSLLQIKLDKIPAGAPWMLAKLKSQAANFSEDQLEKAYTKLYKIDKQIKTGSNHINLEWHLTYWLVNI